MGIKLLSSIVLGLTTSQLVAFDPIVPVLLDRQSTPPATLLELHQKYGIRRFMCAADSAGFRLNGMPDIRAYEKIGQALVELKSELGNADIELNWWCAPTLRNGLHAPFQHTVNFDGKESSLGLCPFDPAVQQDLAAKIAKVAEMAHPPIILLEDDFEVCAHPGAGFGCFCPRHLAEFSRRAGRNFTREEAAKLFSDDQPETLPLRRIFAEVSRDSLVEMATTIRRAVDQVAPETRIALCESGQTDVDGFFTFAVAQALAGPNTRPMIRITGTEYSAIDSGRKIPLRTAHMLYDAERMPDNVEFIHESDTYPHNTYFMSTSYLETLMNQAFFLGADNSLFYALQYLDDPAEDPAYLDMFSRNRARFDAIRQLGRKPKLLGCQVVHSPLSISAKRLHTSNFFSGGGDYAWGCAMLSRMGIPYSTKAGTPAVIIGAEAEVLSDAELTKYLQSAALLDVAAARICQKRGLGKLLGVDVLPIEKYEISLEQLADLPELAAIRGRDIYNFAYAPAGTEAAQYARLSLHPGAEAMSYFLNPEKEKLFAASSRFVNAAGGRVVVLANTITGDQTSNLFSPRKREMLRSAIEWLRQNQLPAQVENAPEVSVLVRELAGGYCLAVTSYSANHRENVALRLAPEWQKLTAFELDDSGNWQKIPAPQADRLILPGATLPMRTRFIILTPELDGAALRQELKKAGEAR